MSLNHTTGTYTDHGNPASLTDLVTAGAISIAGWIYRQGDKSSAIFIGKDNAYPSGWQFLVDGGNSGASNYGELRWIVFRGATFANATDYISAADAVPAGTWTFVAVTHNESDTTNTRAKLYTGSLSTAVAEVSYFKGNQPGTGAASSDAAANLYVGNVQRNTSLYFNGPIARLAVFNTVLTLGQLRDIQFASVGGINKYGPLMLPDYHGIATQPDFSGNGVSATTTGASDFHVPLRPRFGGRVRVASTTAGSGGGGGGGGTASRNRTLAFL